MPESEPPLPVNERPLSVAEPGNRLAGGGVAFMGAGFQVGNRFVLLGQSSQGLVVVHVERGDRIRLISARRASRKKRKQYAQTP